MRILIEAPEGLCESTIVNESEGASVHKISGIWMQAERKNRNGRIYPREVLMESIREYQSDIIEKCSWGELDHPEDLGVQFKRASHLITKLEMAGNDVYGEAIIMSKTPNGQILENALELGGKVGVSSRGAGEIRMVGETPYVDEGFKLITVDAVTKPSAHGAYVGRMNENYVYDAQTKTFLVKSLINFNEESLKNFLSKATQIMRNK